jgi:hypothetical protein
MTIGNIIMSKNENYLQESQSNIYDSYEIQDPRGKLLFLCDKKKIKWYVKKDLVDHVGGKTYKLKFEPKGPGNTNPFFLERLPNQCVVCGVKERLSKHHIVPYQYRKVLPDDYKNSNHFDVLCVCLDCHEEYEEKANKFKDKMHKELEVPLKGIEPENKTVVAINGILYTLKEKFEELSPLAVENLLKNLRKHVGYNITLEEALVTDFHDIPEEDYFERRDSIFMDKYLAQNHTYEDFILMWRNHFLDTMHPKFMSKNWMDHYKTFFKKPR